MQPLNEYPDLLRILKTYSPTGVDYADQLLELEERLENSDMIVPVLGTQGMGKSTLINAILGEDILPNEADETTCVPVEVRFGEPHRAEVFFTNDAVCQTVHSKYELSLFVDNNYNPGNEKHVTRIVLYRSHPLLRTGMVIVDLPGVGSLTEANEETTKQYIRKLCVALFLVSTSPPILGTDANFIRDAWRSFNSTFFVQNIWDDNSKAEIQEGLEANRKIIKDIARKINVPVQHDIIPVNAYAAAKGSFERNNELIESSHLNDLTSALTEFAHEFRQHKAADFKARVKEFVQSVTAVIQDQIKKSQMNSKELSTALETEKTQFEAVNDEIREKSRAIKQVIITAQQEVRDFAVEKAGHYTDVIKAELFHLIDQGVVDGEHLSKAFSDYQSKYSAEAIDTAYEKYNKICERIQPELEALEAILKREEMYSPQMETFNKAQAFKWEKGMDATIKIAGGIGGILLTTLITGPIGLAVGLAVSIVSGLIGSLSHKVVTNARGRETKHQLEPILERFKSSLTESLSESFDKFAIGMTNQLDAYRKARQTQLDAIQKQIEQLRTNGMNVEHEIDLLTHDQEYLTKWSKSVYD